MAPSDLDMVVARMFEFFGRRTPWHRRLWGVNTLTGVSEAADVGEQVLLIGQGGEALLSYRRWLATEVMSDPGIAQPQRGRLSTALNNKTFDQQAIHEVRHLVAQSRAAYMQNCRAGIANGVSVERLSRSIASLLLDDGFSSSGLHRWLTGVMSRGTPPADEYELLDAIDQRLNLPPRIWRVIVPIEKLPLEGHPPPAHLFLEADARALMPPEKPIGERGFERITAAFCFDDIEAKDEPAAVAVAAERIGRLSARVSVGLPTTAQLRSARSAWVERFDSPGNGRWLHLRDAQRAVEIGTLFRQGTVFDLPEVAARLDDSLQLLTTLEAGSAGAGIASTWAAVESLLRGPSERGGDVAARRMAAIITCSWPRAELTPLCHAYRSANNDQLATDLEGASSNRAACALLEAAIKTGAVLSFEQAHDAAAARRLQRLAQDPASFETVRRSIEIALLRLYRVRNMVMHGGSSQSIVTDSLLRTMGALVGAGIDRVAHGLLACTPPITPLELAARATVNLDQASSGSPAAFAELLEAP